MMRILLATTVLFVILSEATAQDADKSKEKATGAWSAAREQLHKSPDNADLITAYVDDYLLYTTNFFSVNDPPEALRRLAELETFLSVLKPTTAEAKQAIERGQHQISLRRNQINLQQTPLAEFEKKLLDNPNDWLAFKWFDAKSDMELYPIIRTQPAEAQKKLDAETAVVKKIASVTSDASIKQQLDITNRRLEIRQKQIDEAKKLTDIVGKPAAPLAVDA